MRRMASIGTAGLLLGGCFFDPQGSVDATGAATTGSTSPGATEGASESSAPVPTSGGPGGPTSGDPGGDPGTDTGDPNLCGNSQIDPGEECDNGELNNGTNGSICKEDCTKNVCGDGYVAASEGCDDGNQNAEDGCSNDCKSGGCGDGLVGPGEECDAGDQNGQGECSVLCKLPFCGDGEVDRGEECDEGVNNGSGSCGVNCKTVTCGNGVVEPGEECDDANGSAGDGCFQCQRECGNGVVETGEECDDGNEIDDDSCDSACKFPAYLVFVTSKLFTGALGGLAGADMHCNSAAQSGKLPGVYKAWISSGVTDANERLAQVDRPYVRVDKQMVVNDWNDLVDGNLKVPINVDELGVGGGNGPISCDNAGFQVWTATNTNGAGSDKDCDKWSSPNASGAAGILNGTNLAWTMGCTLPCTTLAHLYCFQQP